MNYCSNTAGGGVPGLHTQPEPFAIRYEQAFSHPSIYSSIHPLSWDRAVGSSPTPPRREGGLAAIMLRGVYD